MKILKINGMESSKDKGFRAEVVFPSENKYDVTLPDPFLGPDDIDGDREERLRWYFENHLSSPYTDREKAKRAGLSIPAYGDKKKGPDRKWPPQILLSQVPMVGTHVSYTLFLIQIQEKISDTADTF